MKSTHIPEYAGDVEEVTGTLIVDTELREVQSFSATLAQDSTATEASVSAVLGDIVPGGTQKLTLQTWAADGVTPGVNPVKVAWMAVGI